MKQQSEAYLISADFKEYLYQYMVLIVVKL